MYLTEEKQNAWSTVLDSEKYAPIVNEERKNVTAKVLEETAQAIKFDPAKDLSEATTSSDQANVTGAGIDNWNPVLISMVRRAMPNMMAFDLAGVQPMSGPTGLIFAMRSRYTSQAGAEALHDEADTDFSGTGTHAGDSSGFTGAQIDAAFGGTGAVSGSAGVAMSTAAGETLGTESGGTFAEMAFSIVQTDVTAKTRALKAEFSRELEHDLRKIHGLSAEAELAKILSTEIVGEINREMIRTINIAAKVGAATTTNAGVFDTALDSDGRWSVERWKGLLFQIEIEANQVAKDTRRGRANYIITSSNVASALSMAGLLDHAPLLDSNNLNVDDTGNTFAGILNKRYRLYVDPYATVDYITVGYKGANSWDAGVYYCPYVPMELMRATGEDSFQPKIGMKTRYGVVANPFVQKDAAGAEPTGKGLGQAENVYFRKFLVKNLLPVV